MLLERFYVSPSCTPTRAGLMTGLSPVRYGMMYGPLRPWSEQGLPSDTITLAEQLKANGYRTALVGKWHLGHARRDQWPTARGFDHFYGCLNGRVDHFRHERDGGLDWQRNSTDIVERGHATDLITREATRLIRAHDPGTPLFLFISYTAPHVPIQAPKDLIDRHRDESGSLRQRYVAMIDGLDQGVGAVLDALEESGLADDTLVWFASDNGPDPVAPGSSAPFRGKKLSLFEGGIRAPAVIRWPGQLRAASRWSEPLTFLDVMPTLLGAAGAPLPSTDPLDGRDLVQTLISGEPPDPAVLFLGSENEDEVWHGLLRGSWKLLVRSPRDNPTEETIFLFRLDEDPTERDNLADRYPERTAEMRAEAEGWRATHPRDGLHYVWDAPAGWRAPRSWTATAR